MFSNSQSLTAKWIDRTKSKPQGFRPTKLEEVETARERHAEIQNMLQWQPEKNSRTDKDILERTCSILGKRLRYKA